MKLYTRHVPEFDLVKQVSLPFEHSPNLEFGERYEEFDGMFIKAYRWLFKKIGTESVIWCYQYNGKTDEHWIRHGSEMKTWILDVPDDDVVAILHDDVWEYIINNWNYCPDSEKWYDEGIKIFGNDSKAFDEWYEKKESEYAKRVPKEEQYKALFLNVPTEHCQILIPSPIKPEWVVEVQHASDYDLEFADIGMIRQMMDKDEVEKFCEITESFLNGAGYPFEKDVTSCPIDRDMWTVHYEGWEHLVGEDD